MDQVIAADVRLGARHHATVAAVAEALAAAGSNVRQLAVPISGLPRGDTPARLSKAFVATPEVLVESWRVARQLEHATAPGDIVLVSELAAAGGIFALEQAMKPQAERRSVVIAAGDGEMLQHLAVVGTVEGVGPEAEAAIDWERVAYRFASAVVSTNERATTLLKSHGFDATTLDLAEPPAVAPLPDGSVSGALGTIVLPEPVSRLAQTPTVLRALSGILNELASDAEIFVSPEDRPDLVWIGSTWEVVDQLRATVGPQLKRTIPDRADLVILGDPFAQPDEVARRLRAGGARVLVAAGSAAANRWPDAEVWNSEDDLAEAVLRPRAAPWRPSFSVPALARPPDDPSRAQRVSVAVPVFRELSYLDECLQSIMEQSQSPHEVILIDDGSASEDVTTALQLWQSKHPDVIRLLTQTNRGVCVARNHAIEAMSGDSFVLVDSDDTLHPDFISETAQALRADSELWAVATWTEFFGDYHGVEAKPPFDERVGRRENPIVSTSALVDMRLRDTPIRFVPDLAFLYCEDWAVWSEIVAAGGKMGLVTKPLARHRVHSASGGFRRSELAHSLGKARATAPLR
ncbi:MAG: glycosyltransferase family 2 protein [Acidimicrobiia bacterium]|nr:glycosyltransferase family 2 protein [Acidimicrobiia bacterium]